MLRHTYIACLVSNTEVTFNATDSRWNVFVNSNLASGLVTDPPALAGSTVTQITQY
jgi:hypothetical protein